VVPTGDENMGASSSGIEQLKGYPSSLRTLAFSRDSDAGGGGIGRQVFVWMQPAASWRGFIQTISAARMQFASALTAAWQRRGATGWCGRGTRSPWNPPGRAHSRRPAMAYWIAYSPDGGVLRGQQPETLTILDAATGQHLNSITGLEDNVDGLAVSPDGNLLAICQGEVECVACRRFPGTLEHAGQPGPLPPPSARTGRMATGDQDGKVSLWELESAGRVHRTLRGPWRLPSREWGFHRTEAGLCLGKQGRTGQGLDWKAGFECDAGRSPVVALSGITLLVPRKDNRGCRRQRYRDLWRSD